MVSLRAAIKVKADEPSAMSHEQLVSGQKSTVIYLDCHRRKYAGLEQFHYQELCGVGYT
jgi:hypothetical protein